MQETAHLLSALQTTLYTAIRSGGRIVNMTDQVVVETVIRDYFRAQAASKKHHLVDVGACHGTVAAVFLQDGWSADLFEPDPDCRRQLQSLATQFGARARIFPYAVSDRNQAGATFHKNSIAGLSGLAPSPFGSADAELAVRTVRLDDFLAANAVPAIDFLKIDTEGNDFEALESFDFSMHVPAIVFVEYSFYFVGQTAAVLAAALERMHARGYAALILEYRDDGNFRRNNWTHRLVAAHLERGRLPTAADAFGNVLFFRRDDRSFLPALAKSVESMR
jgi:FkbM family methyltransferase